jgi:hypothetical protein
MDGRTSEGVKQKLMDMVIDAIRNYNLKRIIVELIWD